MSNKKNIIHKQSLKRRFNDMCSDNIKVSDCGKQKIPNKKNNLNSRLSEKESFTHTNKSSVNINGTNVIANGNDIVSNVNKRKIHKTKKGKRDKDMVNKNEFNTEQRNAGNFTGSFPNKTLQNSFDQERVLKSSVAEITHKHCTGLNNWEKFLKGQGKQYKITSHVNEVNSNGRFSFGSKDKSKKFTKVVAMDCEMVGAGENGRDSILARVSIVNVLGECLYDKFVKPKETVTDYRTHVSGVRAEDLTNAEEFEVVQKEVAAILKGRILVGHALKNDLEVLFLTHPRYHIRDTAKFFRKKGEGTPSLKNLAKEYLNVKIQHGEHNSVQDAQAAVQLYNMYSKKWEAGGGNKKNNRIDTNVGVH